MAAIRITGTWELSFSIHDSDIKQLPFDITMAKFVVQKANRTGVSGEMHLGKEKVNISGRLKPGVPSVVTISEIDVNGVIVNDGLEAMLYIPPWWPTVNYEYDIIVGTMIIGPLSYFKINEFNQRVILVSGIQKFV
ncbi:TPA: hypothetical protein I9Y23_000135 [Kluyvera ascorbata]|uniref:Uncharacterized protein n=1 Tax=Kluyvera genomosp. 2 TaxID=2774054 RepID=A0A2T2Y8F2_9ENTR|nr:MULTISPECIES: hypothetical protein [Enterobacteriaceae]HAT3916564.1 hypothetical protein [Kluyvera ascorbata]PSR48718.1 hypothetical protein C8256_01640 [Kluyvera genomosp. 2]BBR20042.1 hypothetical protein WP3S18E05_15220 [Klebsiella sp. WP3-S18-ESBL-05]HAT3941477.1 hypothetical protein [Kluyvera ascorbata]HAT3947124.1 hypothetical protein [Kluyvera ascorbata]